MIVTAVEAIQLRQPASLDASIADGSQDALLVRVHTDAGITGIGEVDSLPHVVKAVIEAPASHANATGLGALLVGLDPLDLETAWHRLYAGSIYYGRRGAVVHALSGIEIALWDIAGKAAGKPIHQLLGPVRRDRVKAYASTLMPATPAQAASVVEEQLGAGFGAVKLGWGPFGRDADLDVALVEAARAASGPDFDLMLDIGMGWSDAEEAIARVRRMEEARPYWIEEPFFPDQYGLYARLAEAVGTPIAAGEEESTLLDFERLIDAGGVGVVQPDVTRAGGIRECLRIAAKARERGRRCVLHSWSTGIIKAASLHVLAAMEEVEYFEDCVQTTELNERLVTDRFPLEDGCVRVPTGPGLGIELDEEVLEECRVKEDR
ncbi:MAG: mandelate racemase/muconate lactonizing enzyme family protein [Actinobacteria bacterium]|nr:mandelate racemase/muconate lactonizing enzyme family protein [Actinomycetota bacterium]